MGSFPHSSNRISKLKLDLVDKQEVLWDNGGTVRTGDYSFFCGKGNENHFGKGFYIQHRKLSVVKSVEFVSDMMPYIVLRGRWLVALF